MTPFVYLYIQDTMSDWEPAYLLPELVSGRFFSSPEQRYHLRLCGRTPDPVTTMGGIRLVPDMKIGEIDPARGNVLILPGSNIWMDPNQDEVLEIVKEFLKTPMITGAICGATMGLARAGLLNNRPHTSNDLDVLKQFCPGYTGDAYYINKPVVTDGNLVTASGFAAVEFAFEVMKILQIMREKTLNAWYLLNVEKKPEYYYQLMTSLGEQG